MTTNGKFPIGSAVVYSPRAEGAKHPKFVGKRAIVTRYPEVGREIFIEVDSRIVLLVRESDLKPAAH